MEHREGKLALLLNGEEASGEERRVAGVRERQRGSGRHGLVKRGKDTLREGLILCDFDAKLSCLPPKPSVNSATPVGALGEWSVLWKSKKEPIFPSKTLWATESA